MWDAWSRGKPWKAAVEKEYRNHVGNETWTKLPLSDLPAGRRLHKFVWVFKLREARRHVQGVVGRPRLYHDGWRRLRPSQKYGPLSERTYVRVCRVSLAA